MTTNNFVSLVLLKATGELSQATFGDEDYTKVLTLGNANIDRWAKEDEWNSLYDPGVSCGTISATDSFDLDDSIREISRNENDYIQIVCSDGSVSLYTTVPASDLQRYNSGNFCARIGRTLRFNRKFVSSDREYGGTLRVPAYLYAEHLSRANDEVPVDDPNWLVAMTAADMVQSDNTLSQNRDDFLAEAVDLMTAMQRANRPQRDSVARSPLMPDLRSW